MSGNWRDYGKSPMPAGMVRMDAPEVEVDLTPRAPVPNVQPKEETPLPGKKGSSFHNAMGREPEGYIENVLARVEDKDFQKFEEAGEHGLILFVRSERRRRAEGDCTGSVYALQCCDRICKVLSIPTIAVRPHVFR